MRCLLCVGAVTKLTLRRSHRPADQGENNGLNPGSAKLSQGYACLLPRMIKSWRREFSTRGASAADFPFGVVSLHGWCGEEEASCNPVSAVAVIILTARMTAT